MDDKADSYVYCTDCKYGDELIEAIDYWIDIPVKCKKCYPYNPEDSMQIKFRKCYEPKE